MATKCSDALVLTRLFYAAYDGDLPTVQSLLKNNALSANVSDPIKGSTALQWASAGGSIEVVKWLIKQAGAEVDYRNKENRSAFFFACEFCHKPVAQFLVEQKGVDVNAQDEPSGHSPLHRACIAGQTRDQAEAMDVISWLLTVAKVDAGVKDLSGCMPGDADLAKEAPSLKSTARAPEIRTLLENTRTGIVSNSGSSNGTSASSSRAVAAPAPSPATISASALPAAAKAVQAGGTPAAAPAAPTAASPATASPASSARPSTTLASARAAAAAKNIASPSASRSASPSRASPGRVSPSRASPSRASPSRVSPTRASPSRVAAKAAALAEKTKPKTVTSPVVLRSTTAAVPSKETPVVSGSGTSSGANGSPSSPPQAQSVKGAAVPRLLRPPSSPQRLATLRKNSSFSSSSSSSSPPPPKAEAATAAGAEATPVPSTTASPPPAASADSGKPSWAKPRPGGVLPRAGGLPVTANSAPKGSPAGKTAAASAAMSSAAGAGNDAPAYVKPSMMKQGVPSKGNTSSSSPEKQTSFKKSPTSPGRPSFVKQSSYSLKMAAAAAAAPPSSANNPATGRAAAVIGASSGPKASTLAAAFENKAKGGRTAAPAPRRGTSGLSSAGVAGKTPSLKKNVSSGSSSNGSSNGGGGNGTVAATASASAAAKRSSPSRSAHSTTSSPGPMITPQELLGKGTVMQRKQVYVAATQKGRSPSPKSAPAFGKKKEGSFMDKVVSMFSISPQSSPATSPTRSSSRSPRKQRSPMAATSSVNSPAEPARLGFFSTNKSFKLAENVEKE